MDSFQSDEKEKAKKMTISDNITKDYLINETSPQSLSYHKYSLSKDGLLCTDSCVIKFVFLRK